MTKNMTFEEYCAVAQIAIDTYFCLDKSHTDKSEKERSDNKKAYNQYLALLSEKTGIPEEKFRTSIEKYYAEGGYESEGGKSPLLWFHEAGVPIVKKPKAN